MCNNNGDYLYLNFIYVNGFKTMSNGKNIL